MLFRACSSGLFVTTINRVMQLPDNAMCSHKWAFHVVPCKACSLAHLLAGWFAGWRLCCSCAGYKPFQGVSYEGIAAAVIQHAMADLPPHLSPAFKSFMSAALTYDPQHRPSALQLLDHPWIQVCVCVCVEVGAGDSYRAVWQERLRHMLEGVVQDS